MVLHQGCPIVARNVIAVALTGAQTNVWSLRNFLAAGFNRNILISALDLVAANHSVIKIEGAFFAVIKGLGADKANVQCHAMIYISADVSSLYLSQATSSDLGVLSLQFLLVGEHTPLNTHKQNSTTKPICSSIRSASGGYTFLGQPNHTCACPQRTAVPLPLSSLTFSCISKTMSKCENGF